MIYSTAKNREHPFITDSAESSGWKADFTSTHFWSLLGLRKRERSRNRQVESKGQSQPGTMALPFRLRALVSLRSAFTTQTFRNPDR